MLKLNIGNPAPFGFEAPDECQDIVANLRSARGVQRQQGLDVARTST